jgi:hypothetical protein
VFIDAASTVEITDSTLAGGIFGLRLQAEVTLMLADTTFVGDPFGLIGFSNAVSTVAAGSTGNINATDDPSDECVRFFVTFNGTLGFNTGDFTTDNCSVP